MRRIRFEQVRPGYVLEYKGEYYIKLQHPIRKTNRLEWNAVSSNGGMFNFYPYEEVSEVGPLNKGVNK
jgi:hypothetical protein